MTEKSVFISTCTRRDLARRRPNRGPVSVPTLLFTLVLAAAAAAVMLIVGV